MEGGGLDKTEEAHYLKKISSLKQIISQLQSILSAPNFTQLSNLSNQILRSQVA